MDKVKYNSDPAYKAKIRAKHKYRYDNDKEYRLKHRLSHIKRYCNEELSEIENYELAKADEFYGWVCHHKLEIHEDYENSPSELMLMNLYYHRPASELIFVTKAEHSKIHNFGPKMSATNKGQHHNEETKRKISESNKGKHKYWLGKKRTEETKHKMREHSHKGKHWTLINNKRWYYDEQYY